MSDDETPAAREREIKLELDSGDLPSLFDHPLLRPMVRKKPARLVSVYFDTAAEELRQAGLALRVRSIGGRHVQTVKRSDAAAAGLFDRPEWEEEIGQKTPDLPALRMTPAGAFLKRGRTGGLRPVFTVTVERRSRLIRRDGAVIELSVDRGSITAAKRSVELCEVEFELKRGPPSALFTLAVELAASVPLRPGVRSKSERGYALRADENLRAVKAGGIVLDAGCTTAEGFRAIARSCLRHMRLNEGVLLQTREPEALHQVRVAIRRLRSALSLFRTMVGGEGFVQIAAELKRVADPLGRARNLDVFLAVTLPAVMADGGGGSDLAALRVRALAERETAYAEVIGLLGSAAWGRFLIGFLVWIETGPWASSHDPGIVARRDRPLSDDAAEAIARLNRKVRKKGSHLERLAPEDRHEVRIWAKKLRYAAEFFAALYADDKKARKRHRLFVETLNRLQSTLGDLNDIATGRIMAADLAQRAARHGSAMVAGDFADADQTEGAQALVAAAAEAHADLRRLKAFW